MNCHGKNISRMLIVFILLIASGQNVTNVQMGQYCFGCICHAISQGECVTKMGCDEHGLCGPFRINWSYWNKAGRITLEDEKVPIGAWTRCVTDLKCASRVVKGYMDRYAEDCNRDGKVDCDDFAQIHHLGRCSEFPNVEYQRNFTNCFYNFKLYKLSVTFIETKGKDSVLNVEEKFPDLIPITNACLTCICQASSGGSCLKEATCTHQKCGMFHINEDYWTRADKITLNNENPNEIGAFERCVTNTKCASDVVQRYMNRFAQDCDGNGAIDCNDYARIHHLGSCDGTPNITYEKEFKKCVVNVKSNYLIST